MMRKIMLRSCPSHLFGHRRSLSETHIENKWNSPAWDSAKCMSSSGTTPWNPEGEKGQSCTFRRALSQSNLVPLVARNENSHQSMGKWRCSRKNGLIVGGDELNKVVVYDRGVDHLNWERKAHENPIFSRQLQSEEGSILRPRNEEDRKQSIQMNSGLLDQSVSVSGNAIVGENCSNLEVGPNGVALICTEKGCSPAHPSETEYTTKRKDSNRIECNRGSCGADSDGTDLYYQKMLELNPGNSLLLTNYAKFLNEVQKDFEKAEKYYKKALMVSPADGEILSMHAKFIWDTQNDAAQAEVYFRKAVEVASEDCYVVAAYAHFLWNSQDDDEEEEEENESSVTSLTSSTSGTTPA